MTSTMNHFEQQSYYELLEVTVTASEEQILDAYARAMETYSPDSIAVYTLADPEQLEALRQRLTLAMETLSVLDKRLEYDRSIGLTRSEEELARMRAESLQHAAGAKRVQAEPVIEVEVDVVTETEPAVEKMPTVEPKVAVPAEPPAPVATPVTHGPMKPAAHSRSTSLLSRPGSAVPPPLPSRNGFRSPVRGAPPTTPSSSMPEKGPLRPPVGQHLGEAPVLAEASAIATAESALTQVAAKARDSRTRLKAVIDIPSDAEFNGELLRRVRESRNLSLQILADRTRISSRHVESIEADRYDMLPAPVYLRGMLMSIARELGLDPLRVSRSYMGLAAAGEKKRN
jgi:hypothetical protein